MILAMTPRKSKFDMPKLRRKCKRMLKTKYGKVVKSLRTLDKVWESYVKHGLVEELIKYGKVEIDKNFSLEIVGEPIVDNPKMFALFSRGIGQRNGIIMKSANLTKGRDGVFYDIVLVDKSFKEGTLYFRPHPKISRMVHEALINTNHHYRIK